MCKRLLRIDDDLLLPRHRNLIEGDCCFYIREYTPGQGYGFSETNQLILNFKKAMSRKGHPDWGYKAAAINQIASEFIDVLNGIPNSTLVPIPPSKCNSDPLYDDRMLQVLLKLQESETSHTVNDLLYLDRNVRQSHGGVKPTVQHLKDTLRIDESKCDEDIKKIILFDDVITDGTHFRACKDILLERFPDAEITGVFVARCQMSQELRRNRDIFKGVQKQVGVFPMKQMDMDVLIIRNTLVIFNLNHSKIIRT